MTGAGAGQAVLGIEGPGEQGADGGDAGSYYDDVLLDTGDRGS